MDYIFEIPPVLAYEITGFKHDESDSLEPPTYDYLSFDWPEPEPETDSQELDKLRELIQERADLEAKEKPWWKFW